jgi:hypothetical protein
VQEVGGLAEIYGSSTNVCIWQRPGLPEVSEFVTSSFSQVDMELRFEVIVDATLGHQILEYFPRIAGAKALADDITRLATVYSGLLRCSRLQLKIRSFGDDMCSRFHVDQVGVRLLCTYGGPGTEWLENAALHRHLLGEEGSGGRADADSGLFAEAAATQQMRPFEVGLFKGQDWPGNEGRGAVHRSPPVSASGARRVLLTIDSVR